jgi:hypothetical protein
MAMTRPVATIPLIEVPRATDGVVPSWNLHTVIALGLTIFVGGFLIGPMMMKHHGSKEDVARATVKKYAYEASLQWTRQHGAPCPPNLRALNDYMNNKDIRDPWDRDYKMRCDALPAGARGIAVWSRGPDGVNGTADDVRSWD